MAKKKTLKTSLTTKTGKQLLGPLSLSQLAALLEKTTKAKEKAKIASRIRTLKSRKGFVEVVEVVSADAVVESAE